MIERVRFTSEAESDILEARRWYNAQRRGWGKVFLQRIRECTRAVQEMPGRFPVAQGEFRQVLVPQFPYRIIYGATAVEVTIYAVLHRARDLKAVRNRLSRN